MGFGHRVYKNFDPRAVILKQPRRRLLATWASADPLLDVALQLEERALKDPYFVDRKLFPNADFYSGILMRAIGIPTEHVHGHLRHRPDARLDRPLEGAVRRRRRPHRPAPAGLRRPDRDRVRADRETVRDGNPIPLLRPGRRQTWAAVPAHGVRPCPWKTLLP